MATATKAAQSGTAATEAAVAQVTETVAAPFQGHRRRQGNRHPHHRCHRPGRQVRRGQDRGAHRGVRRRGQEGRGQGQGPAEQVEAAGAQAFTAEVKKAEAKTPGARRGLRRRGQEGRSQDQGVVARRSPPRSRRSPRSRSTPTRRPLHRYLDVTIEFVDTLKNEAVSDLTRRNAKAVTELVDASVGQAHDLLK